LRLFNKIEINKIEILVILKAQKSFSAVQKPHSKVYGNPIAHSFYSIFPCIFLNMIYTIIIKSSERPIYATIINNRYHRIIRDIFTFGLMTELLTVLRVEVED